MNAFRKLGALLWSNPVTLKELRIGLREKRIFILQVLFLFLLLGISLIVLPQMFSNRSSQRLAESGHDFFEVLFWVQLFLLLFTMPALTCGSLSGERERHSLDMVLASRLSSAELVFGKLGFAIYCLLLLLASALPLASVAFFLGGVSWGQALGSYFELFLFGLMAASVGLFSSARENRSNYSTVQAYLLVLLGCCCLPLYGAMRYEDSLRMKVGPYVWTAGQTVELSIFHFLAGVALYFIVFLFLKARHRLRPQAGNLRAMALSFIAFYGFCAVWLAIYLLTQWLNTGSYHGDVRALTCLYYVVHVVALGFFLNPPSFESQVEASEFRRSWLLSRPSFWLLLFTAGVAMPTLLSSWCTAYDQELFHGAAIALLWLFAYPVEAWLIQRAFLPRWQYGWVYYLVLVLLHFLPALGVFNGSESILKMHYASPLMSLVDAMDRGEQHPELFSQALMFHFTMLALLVPAAGLKRRKKT